MEEKKECNGCHEAHMYGYYVDQGIVYICFKCGKFDCDGFSKDVVNFFKKDPAQLLVLIEQGVLKSIKSEE
jgi:hypothetical protein